MPAVLKRIISITSAQLLLLKECWWLTVTSCLVTDYTTLAHVTASSAYCFFTGGCDKSILFLSEEKQLLWCIQVEWRLKKGTQPYLYSYQNCLPVLPFHLSFIKHHVSRHFSLDFLVSAVSDQMPHFDFMYVAHSFQLKTVLLKSPDVNNWNY